MISGRVNLWRFLAHVFRRSPHLVKSAGKKTEGKRRIYHQGTDSGRLPPRDLVIGVATRPANPKDDLAPELRVVVRRSRGNPPKYSILKKVRIYPR